MQIIQDLTNPLLRWHIYTDQGNRAAGPFFSQQAAETWMAGEDPEAIEFLESRVDIWAEDGSCHECGNPEVGQSGRWCVTCERGIQDEARNGDRS